MDSNKNFYSQSMDDIVFDNRNKGYGAYDLRSIYQKNMLMALGISVFIFVFGLYSPKLAHNLGLISDDEEIEEVVDTTTLEALEKVEQNPDEPPPPPPPPPVEITPPTVAFLEMLAVKKEEADQEAPPTQETLKEVEAGTTTVKGDPNAQPIIIDDNVGGPIINPDDVLHKDVDQEAMFKGGEDAFRQFLEDNLVYPEAAKAYGIGGVAQVYFIVSVDGKISDVSISRTSGNTDLDNEAIRVIRKCSGRFNPAKLNGKAVKAPCSIPITFEIDE